MLWTQPGALSDASDDINYHPSLGSKLLNLASIIEIKCMLIRMASLEKSLAIHENFTFELAIFTASFTQIFY